MVPCLVHADTILEQSTLVPVIALLTGAAALLASYLIFQAFRRLRQQQMTHLQTAAQQAYVLVNAAESPPPFPIVFTGLLLYGYPRIEDTMAMLMHMTARKQIQWDVRRTLLGAQHHIVPLNAPYNHPLERVLIAEINRLSTADGCDARKLLLTLHAPSHPWAQLVFTAAQTDGIAMPIDVQMSGAQRMLPQLTVFLNLVHAIALIFAILSYGRLPSPPLMNTLFIWIGVAITLLSWGLAFASLLLRRALLPLTPKGLNWRAYLLEYQDYLRNRPIWQSEERAKDITAWAVALGLPLPEDIGKQVRSLLGSVKVGMGLKHLSASTARRTSRRI